MGLPPDLEFRTKGQLAIDIIGDALADGVVLDFACGDEVYGNCTQLREFLEDAALAYILRVPPDFAITLAGGMTRTCAEAVRVLGSDLRWEIRSAGNGSKGQRWYAWARAGTASRRHHLLIRRHVRTGELACCYCFVPEGQPAPVTRADPRRRAALAGRGGLRVRQGRLRAGPVPGPPLHRDHPAHRPGHGRRRRPVATWPHRALVRLDAHPPGAVTLVPPPHPARTRPGNHPERPGHLSNGGCRTRAPYKPYQGCVKRKRR